MDRQHRRDDEVITADMRSSLQHTIGSIARHEATTTTVRPLTGGAVATLTEVAVKYIEG
jgi:hypothetical protein